MKHFTISPLGRGMDQAAFLAGDWVFRFPRRELGAEALAREIRLLPRLPELPIAIPRIDRVGEPSAAHGWPWPFAGHRLLRGLSADARALDDRAREKLVAPLAAFLRALHSIAPPDWLPGDEFGRWKIAKRSATVRERIDHLARANELDRRRAEKLSSLLDRVKTVQNRPSVLVHGDLYARHVLVDDAGELAGVIDWGDAHAGDPACDLACAAMLLPAALHDRFRGAYGAADDATWALACWRALNHATKQLEYALAENDAPLAAEARRALAHVEDAG